MECRDKKYYKLAGNDEFCSQHGDMCNKCERETRAEAKKGMPCYLTSCKSTMTKVKSHKAKVVHVCPKCQTRVEMSAKLYKEEYGEGEI